MIETIALVIGIAVGVATLIRYGFQFYTWWFALIDPEEDDK